MHENCTSLFNETIVPLITSFSNERLNFICLFFRKFKHHWLCPMAFLLPIYTVWLLFQNCPETSRKSDVFPTTISRKAAIFPSGVSEWRRGRRFPKNEYFSRPPKGGDTMAVFRIEKTRDYTVMSNHHLRNAGLSLKSKGMLSLPEEPD